jgi:DNA-directed RNA polymerase specialized sigma24 family protein
MAIAYRHCLDLLRKPEFTREVESDLNSRPVEPELSLIGQEILDFVGERSRTLLVLRHYLELSYAEIAAVLEIPQNQVGMALVRARQEALKYAEQRGMRDALR